jgi:hypothetical protein
MRHFTPAHTTHPHTITRKVYGVQSASKPVAENLLHRTHKNVSSGEHGAEQEAVKYGKDL